MMPRSGLLPIFVEHANEMGTSETASNQHHVGSSRADHGPKHAPGGSHRKAAALSIHCAAQHQAVDTSACKRTIMPAQNRLTGTAPLPKS